MFLAKCYRITVNENPFPSSLFIYCDDKGLKDDELWMIHTLLAPIMQTIVLIK